MTSFANTSAALVLACVSVGLFGCSKAASMHRSSSDAPGEPSPSYGSFNEGFGEEAFGEDFGGDATLDFDDADEAGPYAGAEIEAERDAPAVDMAPAEPARKRVFGGRRDRAASKSTLASPSPATPPPAVDGASGDGAAPVPADERPPEVENARHIVYTAGMRVAVFNLEDAMSTAEALPERFGGYVQTLSENQIVLRLPSKSLREVMTALSGYGNVEQRWMRSQDVTAEFTDIESKIRALSKTQEQLLELLDKARTVAEALEVRRALDEITAELEVLKGRMRQLENMTTYSTLTLQFYERGPHNPTPSSNDPFPWVDSLGVEDTEWK